MPIASNRSPRISTSTMAGTLVSSYSPSARIVAAISLSTAFLAPGTSTVPCSSPTRRMVISPPGPGSVFTMSRRNRRRSAPRGGSRPTSMLPWCWQAVTSPTAPLASRAASAPWCGRGRTAPRSPPTSSGRATTSSSSAAYPTARSNRRPARSSPIAARSSRSTTAPEHGGRRRRSAGRCRGSRGSSRSRCAGAWPAAARPVTAAGDPRHRHALVGIPRTASTRARSACSACWLPRRCPRPSSTPCSPRPSSSLPTTSASATAASASPAASCGPGSSSCCPSPPSPIASVGGGR